ncbi:MAG: hypothetical protein RIQ68_1803 [Pseudomonadota bacterium]|jgi:hypothetical protein
MSAYQTSIEQERALFDYVMENGPVDYATWATEFQAFRNQVLAELEKLKIPDEWLVRSSLAASRAWEARNPCPISSAEIEHLRKEAAAALGIAV